MKTTKYSLPCVLMVSMINFLILKQLCNSQDPHKNQHARPLLQKKIVRLSRWQQSIEPSMSHFWGQGPVQLSSLHTMKPAPSPPLQWPKFQDCNWIAWSWQSNIHSQDVFSEYTSTISPLEKTESCGMIYSDNRQQSQNQIISNNAYSFLTSTLKGTKDQCIPGLFCCKIRMC